MISNYAAVWLIDVTYRPCCFLRISSDGFQLFLAQPPFLCTLQTPKNYFEQEVDDLGGKLLGWVSLDFIKYLNSTDHREASEQAKSTPDHC